MLAMFKIFAYLKIPSLVVEILNETNFVEKISVVEKISLNR